MERKGEQRRGVEIRESKTRNARGRTWGEAKGWRGRVSEGEIRREKEEFGSDKEGKGGEKGNFLILMRV